MRATSEARGRAVFRLQNRKLFENVQCFQISFAEVMLFELFITARFSASAVDLTKLLECCEEITVDLLNKELIECVLADGSTLVSCWNSRRRPLLKAIESHAVHLEAIEKLLSVLSSDLEKLTPNLEAERMEIREARRVSQFLDQVLLHELLPVGGGVFSMLSCVAYLRLWFALEVQFPPEERGWLADLRDRLVCAADRQEIDLRGLGV